MAASFGINLLILVCVLGLEIPVCCSSIIDRNTSRSGFETHHLQRRSTFPTKDCTSANDGEVLHFSAGPQIKTIWICQNEDWIPHDVTPSLGKTEAVAASSCKEIRDVLSNECSGRPQSGTYWISAMEWCDCDCQTYPNKTMQVHCEMDLDGGGWTMVWKHSYLEVLPLTTDMYYFSDYFKQCSDLESGWCNIPKKRRFKPTEMLIAAYHNKVVWFAYKGWFNWNIDNDWTGGILIEPKKIVDTCTWTDHTQGIEPAPSSPNDRRLLGINFDKHSPRNYLVNCVGYHGTFDSPNDCRWGDCHWGGNRALVDQQMTIAIYIR